jgi:hypothetical protein
VTLLANIDKKVLQRLEQKGTEPSTIWIGPMKKLTFKHHNEKILCEILSVGNVIAAAADESENRPPINLAQFR